MSVPIDILFAGLIAFVSTDTFEPTPTIAYIVDEPHHYPEIIFTGKVSLERPWTSCTFSSIGAGAEIRCPLGKTDVIFDPPIAEGRLLPSGPPHNRVPLAGEDSQIGWLLRMSNIDGAGGGKAKPNIASLVSATLPFGWNLAESCELDGQDPYAGRRGRPALIGFKPPVGRPALRRQAVAECVRFESRVPEGRLTIRLRNREGQGDQVVIADCREAPCLTISVKNNLLAPTACRDTIVEGAHFRHYYDLVVDSPDPQLIPFSLSEKGKNQKVDKFPPGLIVYGLTSLHPVAPELAETIHRKVGPGRVSEKELRTKTAKLLQQKRFQDLSKDKAKILDLLFTHLEVVDRVICPPTILER